MREFKTLNITYKPWNTTHNRHASENVYKV
jgi:hypothetical protein